MEVNQVNKLLKNIICVLATIAVFSTGMSMDKLTQNNQKNKVVEETKTETKVKNYAKFKTNENILILGDSITELYPINEIYGNLPIVKSGVSGYKTTDILKRMDEMAYEYNPTKVILLIGINDIAYDTSTENVDKTLNNIKTIIKKLKQNRKNTKIYVESIYPINRELNQNRINEDINETIINMNNEIKNMCKESKSIYINMHDELTDVDGNFSEDYTNDGIHPNTLGYAKITRVLTPYIFEDYDMK